MRGVVPSATRRSGGRAKSSFRPVRMHGFLLCLRFRVIQILQGRRCSLARSVFLICPVRSVALETTARIAQYVASLEQQGYAVHWPSRDTNQDDPIGLAICLQNTNAIRDADEVHLWYDPLSQGSIFDLGATVMASLVIGPRKKFVIANPDAVHPTGGKSLQNVVLAMQEW